MNPEYDQIIRFVEDYDPPQHFVVMKARGMGKSMLHAEMMYKYIYGMGTGCPLCDEENTHFDEDLFRL